MTEKNTTKQQINKQKQDYVKQQYLTSQTNYIICVDITHFGSNGHCFVALDLAGRNVIGHCFKKEYIRMEDITQCMEKIIQDRAFLPKIQIIHSDQESFFSTTQWHELLKRYNIKVSRGYSKSKSNQVLERTFRTIKNMARKVIKPDWKDYKGVKKLADPLNTKINPVDFGSIIKKAIENYNNKPHKALFLATPNQMEEALYEKYLQKSKQTTQGTTENKQREQTTSIETKVPLNAKNSPLDPRAESIQKYKVTVLQQYAGNWEQFFVDFRNENKRALQSLDIQNKNLMEQNMELKSTLNQVNDEIQLMKERRETADYKKKKRLSAKKQKVREQINQNDFRAIMDNTKGKPYVVARRRIAFLTMYFTGLRVSNLLLIDVKTIKKLAETGTASVPLIKRGDQNHRVQLSKKSKETLNNHYPDILVLSKDKGENDPLFTTQEDKSKPIGRVNFDAELNKVLKVTSEQTGKHIRTHSFRATVITELLEQGVPVQKVKEIIGHKDIMTTVGYDRHKNTPEEIKKLVNNLDKVRTFKPPQKKPRKKKDDETTKANNGANNA